MKKALKKDSSYKEEFALKEFVFEPGCYYTLQIFHMLHQWIQSKYDEQIVYGMMSSMI